MKSASTPKQITVEFQIRDLKVVTRELNLKLHVHILDYHSGPRSGEGQPPTVFKGLPLTYESPLQREFQLGQERKRLLCNCET